MAKALSVDLRIRVPAAVAGGMTHRAAAERFGVSAASVSRGRALTRIQGDVRPGPLGGDRGSGRIEAQRQLICSVLDETPDITIRELCTQLGERDHGFSFGSVQRFLKRHGLTRKKGLATWNAATAATAMAPTARTSGRDAARTAAMAAVMDWNSVRHSQGGSGTLNRSRSNS